MPLVAHMMLVPTGPRNSSLRAESSTTSSASTGSPGLWPASTRKNATRSRAFAGQSANRDWALLVAEHQPGEVALTRRHRVEIADERSTEPVPREHVGSPADHERGRVGHRLEQMPDSRAEPAAVAANAVADDTVGPHAPDERVPARRGVAPGPPRRARRRRRCWFGPVPGARSSRRSRRPAAQPPRGAGRAPGVARRKE